MKLFCVQLSHKEFLYKYLGTQLKGQHITFGFDTLCTVYSSSGVKGKCHKYIFGGRGYVYVSGFFGSFFNGYYHYIKHNNYVKDHFLTIRMSADFFPYISEWLSAGLKSAYMRREQCNPDISRL